MKSIYRALAGTTTPNAISKGVSKSQVTPDSYHSTLSLRDNHDRVFSSRVTPDSYHSTLSLRDNMIVCFHLSGNRTFWPTLRASYIHTEISDISTGLLHPHRNFGYLHGSLTPTQKFRTSPRVSYTHTEIRDLSPGLLHPHKNFGFLHGSLTPTQKFMITPRVSYTHTKIRDSSPGLLHPHRHLGSLPGSLTPTHKFGIAPRVSYTHTKIWDISPGLLHPHINSGYLPGSLTPTQDLSHTTAGLLHPNFMLLTLGINDPFLLCPTHINYSSFPDSNYESSLDVVPKTNPAHTHQEW